MRYLFFIGIFLFWVSVTSGQKVVILDSETDLPLENALVTSPRTSLILYSDENGLIPADSLKNLENIEISLLGYESVKTSNIGIQSEGFVVKLNPLGIHLDKLVIAATRWAQNTAKVPAQISTITAKNIALQNPQTAADLLGLSGKVFIQKSQQGGGSPMIRGFATNRLIYTVDGVRMNTAIFRSGNIQNVINIDPFTIEKTEVVFGPSSVLYGSDAIGGTMGFATLKPSLSTGKKMMVRGKIQGRFSSANSEKTAHAHVNLGWKKWAWVTSVSHFDFGHLRQGSFGPQDYIKKIHVIRDGNQDKIVQQDDTLLQIPTGYSQLNIMQKIRFVPGENWDMTYTFHWSETSSFGRYDRHNQHRSGLPRYAEWDYGPQSWKMHILAVENKKQNLLYDRISLRLANQHFGESRIERNLNSISRKSQTESVVAWSANLDFIKNTRPGNQLFYGIEFVVNDVRSEGSIEDITSLKKTVSDARYPEATWTSLGFYVQDAYQMNNKWTLQSGVRYNLVQVNADFSNNLAFFPLPFERVEIFNNAVTGSLGSVYRASETLIWRTNIGTAFRSPNVDDMGKFFDSEPGTITVPNPNLDPEFAYTADAGITKIFGDKVRVDLSAYYTILRGALVRRDYRFNGLDSIVYNGELSKVQAIQNAAKATVYGLEGGIEIKMPLGFSLTSDINYQIGREETDDGMTGPSRHVAPLFGVTRLQFQKVHWNVQLNAYYQGSRSYENLAIEERNKTEIYARDAQGFLYAPSWYTLNFKAMYSFEKWASVSVGIENITDQRYRPYSSGVSGAGRNIMVSAAISW